MENCECYWFNLFITMTILFVLALCGIVAILLKPLCPNRLRSSIRYVQTTVRRRNPPRDPPGQVDSYISIIDVPNAYGRESSETRSSRPSVTTASNSRYYSEVRDTSVPGISRNDPLGNSIAGETGRPGSPRTQDDDGENFYVIPN